MQLMWSNPHSPGTATGRGKLNAPLPATPVFDRPVRLWHSLQSKILQRCAQTAAYVIVCGMGTAAQQGAMWGARATDWAERNEPLWRDVYDAVLDAANVGRGSRYLDIGCGTGGALMRARLRGAHVSGLDASANFVAIARQRLPEARIEQGEMEELPFDDASFDVASAVNAVQFAGSAANALADACRVLKPGGIFAVLVWGRREDCEFLSRVMPAVFALLSPSPGAPSPPPFGEPGYLESLMAAAGFHDLQPHDFTWDFAFPGLPMAIGAIMSGAARAIAHAGEEKVQAALEAALLPLVRPGGAISLVNRMRLVTGIKSG